MKLIKTVDAIGCVLCHDITQIIPDVFKGCVFKKGHVIKAEDIDILLSVGKENLYVWENIEGMMHEDDAAKMLKDVCTGENMQYSDPSEGKIEITAACDGLLKINRDKLTKVNSLGEMMIATRHGDFPVKKGDKLAGTRIIPLTIAKEKMDKMVDICNGEKILQLIPFENKTAAIITTGSEVFHGRIQDKFTPVVKEKLAEFGCKVVSHEILDDNNEQITQAILQNIKNVDIVLCTGGMSVDPDDRTPLAIKNTGAKIVTYGAPTLPGAMFLLGYLNNIPIVGLPGCVMYAKRTIFDLILPRLLVNDTIHIEEIISLGEGGLCLNCSNCTYPNCGFGK